MGKSDTNELGHFAAFQRSIWHITSGLDFNHTTESTNSDHTVMWRPPSPASVASSRSSARNVDLYLESAVYEEKTQPRDFPLRAQMWGSKSTRSQSVTSSVTSDVSEARPATAPIQTWQIPAASSADHAITELLLDRRTSDLSQVSQSTLAESMIPDEMDIKTPKVQAHELEISVCMESGETGMSDEQLQKDEAREQQAPAGPLQQQLLSLLASICAMERNCPTIMAQDYQALQQRVSQLEAEKQTWTERHEALFALRDADVSNLIQVRSLLAKERQEHAAMRKLRDDDLQNVLVLREKLARATWAAAAARENNSNAATANHPWAAMTNTMTTTASARGRSASKRLSRESSGDLWQIAKTAAMEQRVLELERHNTELRAQLEHAQAVAALRANPPVGSLPLQPTTTQVSCEAVNIGHLPPPPEYHVDFGGFRSREQLVAKVERLRAENEGLRRDVDRREDEFLAVEHKLECLQRQIIQMRLVTGQLVS